MSAKVRWWRDDPGIFDAPVDDDAADYEIGDELWHEYQQAVDRLEQLNQRIRAEGTPLSDEAREQRALDTLGEPPVSAPIKFTVVGPSAAAGEMTVKIGDRTIGVTVLAGSSHDDVARDVANAINAADPVDYRALRICGAVHPNGGRCNREPGHDGVHRDHGLKWETWETK